MEIIPGKEIASHIESSLRMDRSQPHLAIIKANDDQASQLYVELKKKKAAELGWNADLYLLDNQTQSQEIIALIEKLNHDPGVSGIMLQLPTYKHLQPYVVTLLNSISPEKDMDGLTAQNQGLLSQGNNRAVVPATVAAAIECIMYTQSRSNQNDRDSYFKGKNCLLINHSNLIGRPLSSALLNHNATVTIAHEHTDSIPSLLSAADIIVTATGKGSTLDAAKCKPGAILIDCTTVKDGDNITGDIIDGSTENNQGWYTPVPGGIGPVTIACLMRNLLNLHHAGNNLVPASL